MRQTTEWEDRNVEEARNMRMRLEDLLKLREQRDLPATEVRARDDAADARDIEEGVREDERAAAEKHVQQTRQAELAAPGSQLLPTLA